MPLKINSITPRSGEELELGHFTVLVGPNNCGKSQTLTDICDFVKSGSVPHLTVLENVKAELPDLLEAKQSYEVLPSTNPAQIRIIGVSSDLQSKHEFQTQADYIDILYRNVASGFPSSSIYQTLGNYWVAYLNAESRFKLAAPTETYDSRAECPSNALQAFFGGGRAALAELRTAFREAFDIDIALDWATLRRMYLRVGANFGDIPGDREALDALLKNAPELAKQGDGFRSFAGLVLAMLTFPDRLLLLDEPEAFLHPAQARVLGRWLATNAKKRAAQLVVATHSADFLWGIMTANADVAICRLNRHDNKTDFHVIPHDTTQALVRSPLLSSQPVLDALFHRGVVVCEGDPDRAIYQAVAHGFARSEGGENILFIHGNGKDALGIPIELLRLAGTPVCAVADFDVLNSEPVFAGIVQALTGDAPETHLLELRNAIAAQVELTPEAQLIEQLGFRVNEWMQTPRSNLREAKRSLACIARQASKWDSVKRLGLHFFKDEGLVNAKDLVERLKKIGLFVVPDGELETWIKTGHAKGQKWNRAALEKLHSGNCPIELRAFMVEVIAFLQRSIPNVH